MGVWPMQWNLVEKCVPTDWNLARIDAIFKGGDASACKQYRPISLLVIGYKIMVRVLLSRLITAGAESRVRKTQYGFKSGCCTYDKLTITRRTMDAAWTTKDGSLLMLDLDWSKVFDIVCPDAFFRFRCVLAVLRMSWKSSRILPWPVSFYTR